MPVYVVTIREVEEKTGLDFLSSLETAGQHRDHQGRQTLAIGKGSGYRQTTW